MREGGSMQKTERAPCYIEESNVILMDQLFLDLSKCSVLLQVPEEADRTRRCDQLQAGKGLPYNCL